MYHSENNCVYFPKSKAIFAIGPSNILQIIPILIMQMIKLLSPLFQSFLNQSSSENRIVYILYRVTIYQCLRIVILNTHEKHYIFPKNTQFKSFLLKQFNRLKVILVKFIFKNINSDLHLYLFENNGKQLITISSFRHIEKVYFLTV